MADNFGRDRYQKAVYWKASGFNSSGEVTVEVAKEIPVRIEKGVSETLDPQGNVLASPALLNVDQEIPNGSIFWLGKLADLPVNVSSDLMQVIEYENTPDLKGRKFDRYVRLMKFRDALPTVTSTTTTPPTPTNNVIWDFNSGDISQGSWDTFVGTLPLSEVPPNKKGDNTLFYNMGGVDHIDHIFVPQNYQVPEMLPDGRIWCDRETVSKHITVGAVEQTHCQFSPRGVTGDVWKDSFYLPPNVRYRYTFEVDFDEGGTSEARWDSIQDGAAPDPGNFCIVLDLHPGTFTAPWSGSQEPPIGLYVINGNFNLYVRGGLGQATDYTKINQGTWDFTPGVHTFELEWEVNHWPTIGIQAGANVLIRDGGDEKANFTQEVGIPGGASDAGALFTKAGIYGSRTSLAFNSLKIETLT